MSGESRDAEVLRASVVERVLRLREAMQSAWEQATADRTETASLPAHTRTPEPRGSTTFLARADAFVAAAEIGLRVQVQREPGGDFRALSPHLAELVEFIASGAVHTVAQLRYLETDFFTYWNEGPPTVTRAFWDEIEAAQLPFRRVDHLSRILARGRISSRAEYEFAVDVIVGAEQSGLLSSEEASRLSIMIGVYETGRQGRGRGGSSGTSR